MILSVGFDRKKVNPLILNYGSKLASPHLCLAQNFVLSPKLILLVLSAVRMGLSEKCLIYPNFPSVCFYTRFPVLYQLKIAKRKLLFFTRMALSTFDTVLCKLFQACVRSFLTIQNNSFGFMKDVVFLINKYSLSDYFVNRTRNTRFSSYFDWKRIVKSRIAAHGNNAWTEYASVHQDIEILNKTFSCMTNSEFWEIVDRISDRAFKRSLQIRLMGNSGLQYGDPWSQKSGSLMCLLCKDGNVEDISHFFVCLS